MMHLLNLLLAQQSAKLTLDLTKPGVAVSSSLYGLMTEEINYSYEGGLYGELLRNRTFKDRGDKAPFWEAVGEASEAGLDRRVGIDKNNPISLRVKGAVANPGFWGIPVRPSTKYHLEVWACADASGPIEASLESLDGGTVYAKATTSSVGTGWKEVEVNLVTLRGISPTKDARLVLRTGADRTTWLGYASLFPPTYNGRANGNRPDLEQMLVDMKPKFLRFPGGNYVEGFRMVDRYAWKNTIGPVEFRPGHMSPWNYRSTDGMGLLEFLEWSKDMGAKPLLAVFAGYTLNRQVVKAGPELQPFVDEALDEIEYVTGGPETKWGAQRAKDGHPEPFELEAVEVGNEDGFDRTRSYQGRFVQFYDAIKAKYPNLKVISTTGGKDNLGTRDPITLRKPDLLDEHYYASTWDMMAMATKYDTYDRQGPKIFVGEWASQDVPAPWMDPAHKGPTPNMNCAIADAAFMTGLERNSDVVKMACYAPLLVNVNPGGRQWAVNLIGYDAMHSFGSPSYYAQQMFNQNLGDRTVPASLTGVGVLTQGTKSLPGVFVSATRDNRTLYIKLVNALDSVQDVDVSLDGLAGTVRGTETVISGDLKAMNTVEEPQKIAPVSSSLGRLGSHFHQVLAAHSVNVLKLSLRK